jgi:hypothetical protein
MVGRYLKSLLLVFAFGGLVGPIFLIGYFAVPATDRQLISWMFFAGLLITVADALIALALANYRANSAARAAALEKNGVLALAQITGMSETGTEINDQPLVKLALHVAGPGFAFDTQKRVIASVTRMGNLYARKLVVLVDPATHDFQVDWERSALVNGLVPARFTLSDDNETHDLSGQAGPLMEVFQILKASNIPLNGTLDLRSNPALRQQLQAVVRRAVASQASPGSVVQPGAVTDSPVFTPPKPSAAQRLQELDTLRVTEAITADEYDRKRQQIISDI